MKMEETPRTSRVNIRLEGWDTRTHLHEEVRDRLIDILKECGAEGLVFAADLTFEGEQQEVV